MRILVFVGAIIGAVCLLASFFVAGAPQQAALAATACAFAIIPYVLFRLQSAATAEDQRKEIIELLRQKS